VESASAPLTGPVNVYGVKADAEKKAHKVKTVAGVRDDIQVAGPAVPDQLLERKLLGTIQSDRIGYGTITFNAISLSVENGVATLGGSAYGPVDKDSAIIDASYTAGVKGVVDHIQVDPVSMVSCGDSRAGGSNQSGADERSGRGICRFAPGNPGRARLQRGRAGRFLSSAHQKSRGTAGADVRLGNHDLCTQSKPISEYIKPFSVKALLRSVYRYLASSKIQK
jgi:hypothetical protein